MTDGFLFQAAKSLLEGGFLLPEDVKPFPNGCVHFRETLRDHAMPILVPFESIDGVGLRGAEWVPVADLK